MKGVVHKLDLPIYCERLYVCFDLDTAINKGGAVSMRDSECQGFAHGFCDRNGRWAYLLYVPKFNDCIDVQAVAHESYHVADMVFEKSGVEYKQGSGNEHMAYFLDYIIGRVFDCLDFENKHKEKKEGCDVNIN